MGPPGSGGTGALAAPGVDGTLGAASRLLDVIATAGDPAPLPTDLGRNAQAINEPAARRTAASLAAWVTAACGESRTPLPGPAPHARPLQTLRANITLSSSAFRHAVRLSVALVVAGIVYRGLSLGSGYWVPLTVLFVLGPDYGTTITRGIGRAAGTVVGVTIAWVIVTPFSPSSEAIVALLAFLAFAAYAAFPANYALFSVVLTVLIALVVEFSGGSPRIPQPSNGKGDACTYCRRQERCANDWTRENAVGERHHRPLCRRSDRQLFADRPKELP